MKFLIIHNRYSIPGGEESVVESQRKILTAAGHTVVCYERDYAQVCKSKSGRVKSVFSALYSKRAIDDLTTIIADYQPQIALVHNLYPLISGAVIPLLFSHGIKTIYFAHNFRLICPIGIFFTKGATCERCGQSCWRESQCLVNRCQGSLLGSAAFALRSAWARKKGYFDYVDVICALSDFQADKLIKYGINASKIRVVANPLIDMIPSSANREMFVGIVGRFSVEKGAEVFLRAARLLPDLKFKVAGDVFVDRAAAPANVEFVGRLNKSELADFYSAAKIIVSCSIAYETFGLTVVEAMHYGAAVVVANVAAMPSLVDNGEVGLLFESGNAKDLARKIEQLFTDNELCDKLSAAGTKRSEELCSDKSYLHAIENIANSLINS